jgi:hypothetical protein
MSSINNSTLNKNDYQIMFSNHKNNDIFRDKKVTDSSVLSEGKIIDA